jgi:hypothetical protein
MRRLAVTLLVATGLTGATPLAQSSGATPTSAAAESGPGALAPAPAEAGKAWPRAIDLPDGTLQLYQPQLEKFEGVKLSGRSATSWTEKDKDPVFGVIWFDARVLVDKDARDVDVEAIEIRKVRFLTSRRSRSGRSPGSSRPRSRSGTSTRAWTSSRRAWRSASASSSRPRGSSPRPPG